MKRTAILILAAIMLLPSCSSPPQASIEDYILADAFGVTLPSGNQSQEIANLKAEVAIAASLPAPVNIFQPCLRAKVLTEPRDADLLRGCLPRAIASHRIHGGRIVQTAPGHVENLY